MAKFILVVKHEGDPDDKAWEEPGYDTSHAVDPETTTSTRRLKYTTIDETQERIEEYGRQIIDWFNKTLVPGGERREFVAAMFASPEPVSWKDRFGEEWDDIKDYD